MQFDKEFDRLFSSAFGFEPLLNTFTRRAALNTADGFPPYSIYASGPASEPTGYTIEMAVAGFSRDMIEVTLREDSGLHYLTIRGSKNLYTGASDTSNDVEPTLESSMGQPVRGGGYTPPSSDPRRVVRGGLSYRDFYKEFNLAESVLVDKVKLENGILTIDMSVKTKAKTGSCRKIAIT